MEKTWRHRSRHLGNALKDLNSLKEIDQEDGRGCREGCYYSRERETIRWAKELIGSLAWPRSSRVAFNLPTELKGED